MADNSTVTPYSTAKPYWTGLPSWVPVEEQERVASYGVYEDIYWNEPSTFKLVARGTEDKPIYVPNARVIVDTTNRYVGKMNAASGLSVVASAVGGVAGNVQGALDAFTQLFRRERWYSKYASEKRFGLIRGDWCFHVIADPAKPAGSRISIVPIHPSSYFPVTVPGTDRVIKVHIADEYMDLATNTSYVMRQTYQHVNLMDPTSPIVSTLGTFSVDHWYEGADDGPIPPASVVRPPVVLAPDVTSFPVYHIKNFDESGNPYGSSELRGLERIMAAVNQSVSDEDIALALEGLGLYATASGAPEDEDGNITNWIIGPGRVLEHANDFHRVPGVGSVQPYSDHINRLTASLREAAATPDIAVGRVDATVAESGVALILNLGPMLGKAEEKDTLIADVLSQIYYDLQTMWFPGYEQVSFLGVDILPAFSPKVPTNRKQLIDEIVLMMSTSPPMMSAQTGRSILSKEGIQFDPDESALIDAESQAVTANSLPADPAAIRAQQELNGGVGGAA